MPLSRDSKGFKHWRDISAHFQCSFSTPDARGQRVILKKQYLFHFNGRYISWDGDLGNAMSLCGVGAANFIED